MTRARRPITPVCFRPMPCCAWTSLAACDWQAMLADLARLTGLPARAARSSVGNTTPVGCSASANVPSGDYVSGTPIWVPVTLRFEGRTWNQVGMRFKGSTTLLRSWQAGLHKLPFRLHFDRFEDRFEPIRDQRFFGFQKLSFGNQVADPSFLREKITSDLLREHGVPAARTAWVRPFVTGAMGEQIGSRFSALDSVAQFDNAQATVRAVIAQRRALVPAMLP